MKKTVSLLLSAIIVFSALSISACAVDGKHGDLNIMTYNVSGIPIFGDTQGSQRKLRGDARMAKIGELLCNESGCDLIGTQEDFNNHDALAAATPAFPYQTLTSGGLPLGDGLNVFSKYPIYNVTRTKWDSCYGVVSGSADRLAEKGILSCVVEIEEGVYIDFFVVHADAGVDSKSVEARADNFRQIADIINSREDDRAAIVIGDFNYKYERNLNDKFYENLVSAAGLTDCWTELCNGGDYSYDNGENWNPSLNESLDKVMFKNGSGIEFTPDSLEYIEFKDADGKTYTDHISTKVSISYTVTGETNAPSSLKTQEPIDEKQRTFDEFKAVINAVVLVFTNLHELFYLIGQGFDLIGDAIKGS